ncbi:hypothetical protein GCM10010404_16790 [Nonomuraea africana]|uniref:Uncharacterized protein n=1 Tax=Nonomuraea africana TaxID=46171 RepID=A0ABR9KLV0_9ACTN|nr:hypothetical protein [Nonomuraea africana]
MPRVALGRLAVHAETTDPPETVGVDAQVGVVVYLGLEGRLLQKGHMKPKI